MTEDAMRLRKRCGAKTRSGSPCQSWAMENGRCRMHGGKQKRGPERHNYKHGLYSKALPKETQEALQERVDDPDLISHRESLALMDLYISRLVEMLETGGIPTFTDLKAATEKVDQARLNDDTKAATEGLNTIWSLIHRGAENWQALEELRKTVEVRSRVSDRERRRVRDAYMVMTIQQVQVMIDRFYHAIKPYMKDDTESLANAELAIRSLVGTESG